MTNPELPDGVTTETVYAVEISYAPDAAEKRPAIKPLAWACFAVTAVTIAIIIATQRQ